MYKYEIHRVQLISNLNNVEVVSISVNTTLMFQRWNVPISSLCKISILQYVYVQYRCSK